MSLDLILLIVLVVVLLDRCPQILLVLLILWLFAGHPPLHIFDLRY